VRCIHELPVNLIAEGDRFAILPPDRTPKQGDRFKILDRFPGRARSLPGLQATRQLIQRHIIGIGGTSYREYDVERGIA
jgi:hypothetical protein